ncbi:hypothetical protein [Synechococcus lacustris]|uniref:hypothetical protein n=1 Tax=Synechococcus lacustris TaxID=2116544 RepID=UPI0020CE0F2C|nr:hypothetical protein [Synechococcus lacustris]MCP9815005.1 hypothetical protein [Synechococcus lacustris L1E-Slac]
MNQQNVLTSAELKRRGIAAIEQALQHGPVHLLKRNRSAAVVLSEQHEPPIPMRRHWIGCLPCRLPRFRAARL